MHEKHPMSTRGGQRGFSLIELVIVVVIIGIIAAIAVPRMSRGAKGADESSLKGSLAVFRTAIDLYAAEHGGNFPAGTSTEVVDKLTTYSDVIGATSATKTTTHIYGPYVKAIPPLPLGTKKGKTGVHVTAVAADLPPQGLATDGWWFNSATGDARANLPDAEVDDTGTKYNAY